MFGVARDLGLDAVRGVDAEVVRGEVGLYMETREAGQTVKREAFEAWASDGGKWPRAVERSGDGYVLMSTHHSWIAWQAALRSAAPTTEPRPDVAGLVERAEKYLRFEMLAEPIDETALIRDLLAALKEGAK